MSEQAKCPEGWKVQCDLAWGRGEPTLKVMQGQTVRFYGTIEAACRDVVHSIGLLDRLGDENAKLQGLLEKLAIEIPGQINSFTDSSPPLLGDRDRRESRNAMVADIAEKIDKYIRATTAKEKDSARST